MATRFAAVNCAQGVLLYAQPWTLQSPQLWPIPSLLGHQATQEPSKQSPLVTRSISSHSPATKEVGLLNIIVGAQMWCCGYSCV